jgi:hypothetical protein
VTRLHRPVIILLITLLCLAGIPVSASQPATETRLMLSHKARFTAEIPADWGIDRAQNAEYISPDGTGYIVTTVYPASLASLTTACRSAAPVFDTADDPDQAITWTTFAGNDACRLESPEATGKDSEPIGLIFRHPNPLRSGIDDDAYYTYAGIMVDRAHFDNVTSSMNFTLDDVTPELYVESALDIIEGHAYLRDEVDWETVRADALAIAADGDTMTGIDIALEALEAVGDGHSYRWDATQLDDFNDTDASDIPATQLPTGTAFTDQVSYINLPPIQGDESVSTLYATAGNQVIADLDTPSTCGWIIDLRTNFGGISDPMIAAVGEILGEGSFGGFAYSDDTVTMESYEDGSVFPTGNGPGASLIEGEIHSIANPDAAVAILIGPVTGSAAEYTAIAFIGRPQTQTFGEPSADLTTGISGYILADGAAIGLATSAMIDRNGTTYPDGIQPDTWVEYETASIMDPADPVAAAATDWLLTQPACAA